MENKQKKALETVESHLAIIAYRLTLFKSTVGVLKETEHRLLTSYEAIVYRASLSQAKEEIAHVESLLLSITES